jgi:hypothetical protein
LLFDTAEKSWDHGAKRPTGLHPWNKNYIPLCIDDPDSSFFNPNVGGYAA